MARFETGQNMAGLGLTEQAGARKGMDFGADWIGKSGWHVVRRGMDFDVPLFGIASHGDVR